MVMSKWGITSCNDIIYECFLYKVYKEFLIKSMIYEIHNTSIIFLIHGLWYEICISSEVSLIVESYYTKFLWNVHLLIFLRYIIYNLLIRRKLYWSNLF